jgi:hypothetical protein
VVDCGEEELGEACNTPRFLEHREGGQGVTRADESTKNPHVGTVHRGGDELEMRWSRWILMGKEWLGGMEEDTRLDPAHRRGGWCGVEAGRRELASAAMAEKKKMSTRGLIECKTKQQGGSVVGDTTWRQGKHGARHPDSCAGAAETDVGRAVPGAVRE